MSVIDPDSPREWGLDSSDRYRELGDRDSDGVLIGYIDEHGTCWESRKERDISLTCGRYHDAFVRFNRSGGLLGSPPDAEAIAEDVCLPQHVDEAVREALDQFDPHNPLCMVGAGFRARSATMN